MLKLTELTQLAIKEIHGQIEREMKDCGPAEFRITSIEFEDGTIIPVHGNRDYIEKGLMYAYLDEIPTQNIEDVCNALKEINHDV
jgi:hypothetical protein